ncbi:hypothetical protein Ddc_16463 [Ditylenchus destructor]|nr:hypothetical protein Ddc_16463 [Ditylenchus destructor]
MTPLQISAITFLYLFQLTISTPVPSSPNVSVHSISDCYEECGFFDSSDKTSKPFQFVAHIWAGFGNCSRITECNAAIIGPKHLLTFAQCLHYPVSKLLECGIWPVNATQGQMSRLNQAYLEFQSSFNQLHVTVGQSQFDTSSSDSQELWVSKIYTSGQNWASPANNPNDFAIVELLTPLAFNESVRKICVLDSVNDVNELANLVSEKSTSVIGFKQAGTIPSVSEFDTVATTVDFYCEDEENPTDSACISSAGSMLPGALITFDNNGRQFLTGQLPYQEKESFLQTQSVCSWISETTAKQVECQVISEPSEQCKKILEANKKKAESGSSVKPESFLDKVWSKLGFLTQG